MTQYLPPNLLALFAPRDPIPYFPPLDVLPWEKKSWPYKGISEFTKSFEDPSETPPATRAETKEERTARKHQEREERECERLKGQVDGWDLSNDPNVDGDPFKTLFVGRINYDTSESKLRREFETYGRIKRINMVMNSANGKPRGYAFIEYEKERDMHSAYKHADGKKIDGRRVVVDVERGRTVKSWKPRRLGGGLGGTRRGGPNENIKYSGRVDERDIGGGGDNQDREDKDRDRDRDRERDQDRDRDRDRRSRDRDRERRNRSASRERERRRSRSRDRDRERKDRSRSRSRDRRDHDRREKSRDRDRGRDKSSRKDKDRDRDRERDRDKDKEKSKDRSKEKEKDKERHRSSRDYDRDRDRDRHRDRKRDREDGHKDSDERSEKRIKVDHSDNGGTERRDNGTEDAREAGVKVES